MRQILKVNLKKIYILKICPVGIIANNTTYTKLNTACTAKCISSTLPYEVPPQYPSTVINQLKITQYTAVKENVISLSCMNVCCSHGNNTSTLTAATD